MMLQLTNKEQGLINIKFLDNRLKSMQVGKYPRFLITLPWKQSLHSNSLHIVVCLIMLTGKNQKQFQKSHLFTNRKSFKCSIKELLFIRLNYQQVSTICTWFNLMILLIYRLMANITLLSIEHFRSILLSY